MKQNKSTSNRQNNTLSQNQVNPGKQHQGDRNHYPATIEKLETNAEKISTELHELQCRISLDTPEDLIQAEEESIGLLEELNNISSKLDAYSVDIYEKEENLEKYHYVHRGARRVERIIRHSLDVLPIESWQATRPTVRRMDIMQGYRPDNYFRKKNILKRVTPRRKGSERG
ncbi:hypothetical protein ACOJQI_03410 [Bacillus salacetis]|uniref:hypothetical protein n=1 Tax=Bacillus salacetis TaxID=2315464 RepID=UPI003BA1598F